MQVDGLRFVNDLFPDGSTLCGFLKAYGVSNIPSPEVLRKWKQRGVPGNWVLLILALLEIERGEPQSIAAYIEG